MKYMYLFFALVIMQTNAQTSIDTIQKEIDQTVWKPFQTAFETLDAEALNNTYAANVLRVTPEKIDTKNVFKKGNIKRFMGMKEKGNAISLDFWFDDRKTNETTSYEVGFYRIGFTLDGKTEYSYGQFHIVLQKIDGQWKITQDWDTTAIAGETITASHFKKKEGIRF
ncbi:nuclear transport factor 2 family protein [Aquimarina sp. AU474]|uniref:nuclear transport factor 2 family protein n=1 Tax=Aquimarina sp. AU474 TaxID=2108529 RepID=UPI000D68798B|nr:nuclear transport factor 2 family protein [Aquimarina sp. AU474]